MKKIVLLIIIVLLTISCATIKSKTTMGYDLVSWGSSIEKVKEIYVIGDEAKLMISEDNPDMIELIQENISENIKNRTFYFFENKLVIVTIVYNDSSDDNLKYLQDELENKFGNITDVEEELDKKGSFTKTFTYGQYSPDLLVKIAYSTSSNTILVSYFWEKGIYEYMTSLKTILKSM